jgi:uncharacterized protein (AIM24 family)
VQSLEQFLEAAGEKAAAGARFDAESARTLRIDVDGGIWLKPGAAIAYRGEIAFVRLPTLGARSLAGAALREAAPLVRAVGKGRLYCGHHGCHAHIIRLAGESLVVAWQDLLAFEESLAFEAQLVGHGVGIAAGGLVVMKLSGHGSLALATHGQPLALSVSPGHAVKTDPHATLAWSAELTPLLKTDLSWRSAFAHGGQEPVQMTFDGSGFVIVQPYEDRGRFHIGANPIKKLVSMAAGVSA